METQNLTLPVLRVRQKIGEFFVASIKAQDLVSISYADVRRLAEDPRDIERYLGIQRPVQKKRVKDIRKYLEGGDATFPTAVIIAVDQKCAEFDSDLNQLTLHAFVPDSDAEEDEIEFNKIARVIDGQHRIAAFMDENNNWAFEGLSDGTDFEMNIAIFVGADLAEQANIFATVNLAQTKVNRSLVYDLTELATYPSPHKTCHNVAVMLDGSSRSPLYKRIKRLGVATPGRRFEPITQAAFVESLIRFISPDAVSDRNLLLAGKKIKKASENDLAKSPFRNLFIEGREVDIAEIIFNYFSAVRNKWPDSWDNLAENSNLLPKSNAFKALMKYLK